MILKQTTEKVNNFRSDISGIPCIGTIPRIGTEPPSVAHYPIDNPRLLQIRERAFALNYVSDPVFEYDRDFRIIWANKAACQLSRLILNELLGVCCGQTHSDLLCDHSCCPVAETFETGLQTTGTAKTYDNRTFSIRTLPFMDTSGEVDSVIEIFTEQTRDEMNPNIKCSDYAEVMDFHERLETLTDRENQIMTLVVFGKSNRIISHELEISEKTVEIHRSRVMKKLQVDSFAQLVRLFTLFDFYTKHIPGVLAK